MPSNNEVKKIDFTVLLQISAIFNLAVVVTITIVIVFLSFMRITPQQSLSQAIFLALGSTFFLNVIRLLSNNKYPFTLLGRDKYHDNRVNLLIMAVIVVIMIFMF